MVRGWIEAMRKEVRGMHEAAYLLAIFALLSQLLALLRDRLFASQFGIGETLDVYYAAFRIPDFLFTTIASLFSLYAILPVLTKHRGGETRLIDGVLVWFFALIGAIAAVVYVFVPTLALHLAPGFSDGQLESVVRTTRILLLQPILLGASNILASLTQLRSRFMLYAISPVLYNAGIIFGALYLYPSFGIDGLAYGVLIGAALHLLVQVPHYFGERISQRGPLVPVPMREILTLSVPRTLALSASQLTMLALVSLASTLSAGSISAFTFSMNLQSVPLAIIGVSYSVAAFPTLARLIGEGQREEFIAHMGAALRHIFFWSIPALVLVIVLRAQIVRVVLGAGAFDWNATRLTAALLAVFIVSLLAQGVVYLVARGYYASGNTKRPLLLALIFVLVSIVTSVFLLALFNANEHIRYFFEALLRVEDVPGTEILMLGLGFSIGCLVHAGSALFLFHRDFKVSLLPLVVTGMRSFAAAVIGGFASYSALTIVGEFVDIGTLPGIFAQGLVGGVVGVGITALVLQALRSPELEEVVDALRRKFRDKPDVAVEASELTS